MAAGADSRRPASRERSRARRLALQALYQWQLTGMDAAEVERQFHEREEYRQVDAVYFRELVLESVAHCAELDAHLGPLLDRPIHEVDPVERAILRVGAYELAFRPDIPYRVVINEAVELARKFGAEQGHAYINGVLDQVARVLRGVEHPAGDGSGPVPGGRSGR
ncbi:MAG: transcription antitermination factor NusB [Gammaproteobacteria bacterium]